MDRMQAWSGGHATGRSGNGAQLWREANDEVGADVREA
ncbi:hypothetical protein PI124_g21102 [Phytophthora idaei]|nr:hypothetical protein PI126_g20711 [Phytophthora idaei]KAG3233832.1 hypothetical protein PI124_g21102 [Phytophthora idaei]